MNQIIKVNDDGWGNGETYVEVCTDVISHGDTYLSMSRNTKYNNYHSIELCDSKELANHINKNKKYFKKIIKSSKQLHRGTALHNFNVSIIPELKP